MKQVLFKSLVVRSLAFIMLMMCAVPASAQYYMNVYKNDGQKYQFLVSDIDSVSITQDIINNPYNGYEYVDLGLPSGLKWATCNVGASSPEFYGSYFAWGETSPKSDYDWSTYKHCNGSSSKLTKYNVSSSSGTVDNITTLELEDDAAHVNWGGAWRMPTYNDWNELKNNCYWRWTTLNGIKGYKVTSESNGNSIFLPAAGFRTGADVFPAGSGDGRYWSSSLYSSSPYRAYYLYFGFSWCELAFDNRFFGYPVRAVCP